MSHSNFIKTRCADTAKPSDTKSLKIQNVDTIGAQKKHVFKNAIYHPSKFQNH